MKRKNDALRLETKYAQPLIEQKFDAATGEISGYASKFGIKDLGGDMVMKGAYTASLTGREAKSIKMLWQHDPREVIGVWDEVKEDEVGLYVKGRILSDIAKGKEAITLITAGALDGLSIGYKTVKADRKLEGVGYVRQLKEVSIWEVSLVTFPMLPSATLTGKGRVDAANPRDVENALCDAGLSRTEAKRICASGVKAGSVTLDGDDTLSAFAEYLETQLK